MKNKFKPGDKVKCIDDKKCHAGLKSGKIYTVDKYVDHGQVELFILVKELPDEKFGMLESRFNLAKEAAMTKAESENLKAGDVVIFTKDRYSHNKGETAVVAEHYSGVGLYIPHAPGEREGNWLSTYLDCIALYELTGMTEAEFKNLKPDDFVIAIENSADDAFIKGVTYKVKSIKYQRILTVRDSKGDELNGWHFSKFKLVDSKDNKMNEDIKPLSVYLYGNEYYVAFSDFLNTQVWFANIHTGFIYKKGSIDFQDFKFAGMLQEHEVGQDIKVKDNPSTIAITAESARMLPLFSETLENKIKQLKGS